MTKILAHITLYFAQGKRIIVPCIVSAVMHVCVCARERQITRTNSNNFIKEKRKKKVVISGNEP
jgi:3-polyprenyl-4-hydroxybenzoate decarboxylase